VSLESSTRDRLARINASSYPQQSSKRYERTKVTRSEQNITRDSTRFHFDMDMGPYWFEPLGLCFGLPQSSIEAFADRLIIDEWRHSDFTGWEKDERWRRKIFEDRETSYRHTSYPRTDDLRFYLSYHALMVIAGRLLASTPSTRTPMILKMNSSRGYIATCSLGPTCAGLPTAETLILSSGPIGRTRSKRTTGAGLSQGPILIAFLA
jgi:hypothetical protein